MLKFNLEKLEKLLSNKKPDGTWAHDLNYLTMEISEDITEESPSSDSVKKRILPLLRESYEIIQQIPRKGNYSKYIDSFSENIKRWIKGVKKYIINPHYLMEEFKCKRFLITSSQPYEDE